ncbi:MAG: Mur ligase domain-containing protein [Planctomycetota bacterium]|nr:Mur ligase domain-containing protein [Planctomycetota bacterium]
MTIHFSGIAGAGMNPLARLLAAWGERVQGSDRSFDAGQNREIRAALEAAGIRLWPQDGRAITAELRQVVYSSAVEAETAELRAARALGIPCQPRPELLAALLNRAQPGVAVSGTSGKSSVVGMLAWILRCLGVPASVLGGAALAGEGTAGLLVVGPRAGPLIAEACESDGSLVGYHPAIGVVHNISRDHGELDDLQRQFAQFAAQCRTLLVNADCPLAGAACAGRPQLTYGAAAGANLLLEPISAGPQRARGVLSIDGRDLTLDLPVPGEHTLSNAAAALAVVHALALDVAAAAAALASWPGVARRFEIVALSEGGVRVIDDYAHNPAKIAAAVRAAQLASDRVLCLFQPHGYGPAKLLRPDLARLLPELLRPQDAWLYLPIYYAGGTVTRDISSADLARDSGVDAVADRREALGWVCARVQPGDTVLIMGARDPTLPEFARALAAAL